MGNGPSNSSSGSSDDDVFSSKAAHGNRIRWVREECEVEEGATLTQVRALGAPGCCLFHGIEDTLFMKSTRQDLPGLVTVEHEFTVPLDHQQPNGESIRVFAREVSTPSANEMDLPWLLYLQGGPGYPAPRPNSNAGWLARAMKDFRVLLLDQRGTGNSTPVTHESLARFTSAQQQADYLQHFRADSIVADAEHIRRELQGEGGRWTLLGQSFGGFCAIHYLSVAPASLAAVLITGGLPGLDGPIEAVYRRTYAKMAEKNRSYYARYPRDVEHVREIAGYLTENDVKLPGGASLTVHRLQSIGGAHGMSDGFESLHYLLEGAFVEGANGRQLSYSFLRRVEDSTHYDTNPIYAILHESIYAQGSASEWCASRLREEFSEFDEQAAPLFFTAEMIYPWMFSESPVLASLAEAAEILASKTDWGQLYDTEVLSKNVVPVAAAVYHDDAYVPVELSLATAARIQNCRTWITNEYEHNGLRVDGSRIVARLLELTRGEV
ncbi:MAG: pimeloyl-ACP methyl ester carboxylesterase [Candidatus Paceibacteria bacterium]|jgi:pimeloyl-ACP methyl ester carboxylesterase